MTPAGSLVVGIDYSADGGATWTAIAGFDSANDGAFSWTVPSAATASGLIRVRATDAQGNVASDTGDGVFAITVSGAPVTSVSLGDGWNLISLPRMPVDSSVATVLESITGGTVERIRYYDATVTDAGARWKNWTRGVDPALNNLSDMKDGSAYWVQMTGAGTLDVSGANWTDMPTDPGVLPPSYQVVAGWNMVGFKSTTVVAADTYLTGTSHRLPIYQWVSGAYSQVTSGNDGLQAGRGYWVYFNADGTITP